MTHQMVRRYAIPAWYDDSMLVQVKETCQKTLVGMMKDDGYVPLLDVNPVWQSVMTDDGKFAGVLTWQAVYVGKDKAWETDGVMDGKLIPSTPRNK